VNAALWPHHRLHARMGRLPNQTAFTTLHLDHYHDVAGHRADELNTRWRGGG
jgi:hypothetical protein